MITLFDIPSTLPNTAWSAKTWKTRYNLNDLGLPYKTQWVSYPSLPSLYANLNLTPTFLKETTPLCTLPVIYDDITGIAVADGLNIAKYLDEQYPSPKRAIPRGTEALQAAFDRAFFDSVALTQAFVVPDMLKFLNDENREHYSREWAGMFGVKRWEDLVLTSEEKVSGWSDVEEGFGIVGGWMNQNDGPYVMGEQRTYADYVVAAYLRWIKSVWGEESKEWKDLASWDEGKWGRYLSMFKDLERVEATDSSLIAKKLL